MAELSAKRRRLSPDGREQKILVAVCQLVHAGGTSNLTMGKLANEACASKALLYSYFPNSCAILQRHYKRELGRLQAQHLVVLVSPHSFEDTVKQTASNNRVNQNKRQLLIKRPEGNASVRTAMSKTDMKVGAEVEVSMW
jgi:AcrR family transcriptional regulator